MVPNFSLSPSSDLKESLEELYGGLRTFSVKMKDARISYPDFRIERVSPDMRKPLIDRRAGFGRRISGNWQNMNRTGSRTLEDTQTVNMTNSRSDVNNF